MNRVNNKLNNPEITKTSHHLQYNFQEWYLTTIKGKEEFTILSMADMSISPFC